MKKWSISSRVILIALTFLVFVPNAICVNQIHLRSQSMRLSDSDVKSMLIKYNFFDRTKNKNGAFANDLRNNNNGTVTDRATGLMWQKGGSSDGMEWLKAKEYVNQLNNERFAGYSDWRLPTIEELASLMKSMKAKGMYIDPLFSEVQEICWSADAFGTDIAWYASFKSGMIRHIYRFFYYVRTVRTIK